MYSKLVSFNDGLYKVYKVIMMILLAVMSVWVFAAVILRETGTSAPWIEEFTIYAFSWLTYFGAAGVLRDDGHLSVTAVTNMIKNEKAKRAVASSATCWFWCSAAWFAITVPRWSWFITETATLPPISDGSRCPTSSSRSP